MCTLGDITRVPTWDQDVVNHLEHGLWKQEELLSGLLLCSQLLSGKSLNTPLSSPAHTTWRWRKPRPHVALHWRPPRRGQMTTAALGTDEGKSASVRRSSCSEIPESDSRGHRGLWSWEPLQGYWTAEDLGEEIILKGFLSFISTEDSFLNKIKTLFRKLTWRNFMSEDDILWSANVINDVDIKNKWNFVKKGRNIRIK